MKTIHFAAALVVAACTIAASAFASGYGPSPYYRAEDGAPVSQAGIKPDAPAFVEAKSADTYSASVSEVAKAARERYVDTDISAISRH